MQLYKTFTNYVALSTCFYALETAGSMNNILISFSTQGPDHYFDGSIVADGESYALVWTPDGSEFSGINLEGKALGESEIVMRAPVAKNGHCPNVQFQIDESYAQTHYPRGTWSVYLLDTRLFLTEIEYVVADGVTYECRRTALNANNQRQVSGFGKAVRGYGLVVANVCSQLSGRTVASVQDSCRALDFKPPQFRAIRLVDDKVFLYAAKLSTNGTYGVAIGHSPDILSVQCDPPICGPIEGEWIFVLPQSGSSEFFRGVAK